MNKRHIPLPVVLALCLSFCSAFGTAGAIDNEGLTFYSEETTASGLAMLTATVVTDTSDYAPGDSVLISGAGYWPNETVEIEITNVFSPGFAEDNGFWSVQTDETGSFETAWIVPEDGVDQTYLITATGLSSSIVATVEFTDTNTRLKLPVTFPDIVCAGAEIDFCAYLTQKCGCNIYAPLPNRPILFFINPGNCGVNAGQVPDDTVYTDSNGLACSNFTMPTVPGVYSMRIKFPGESKPAWWQPPNSACDPSSRVKLSSANDCITFEVVATPYGDAPVVTINDTTVTACSTTDICLPFIVEDGDCDIESVSTNLGSYGGNTNNFDQVSRFTALGATITQVGGGDPGKLLTSASDFVPPINTHSGVSLTLPNFVFASSVVNYGSFPSGIGPAQSADQLVGAPTDLTFTLPGAGGPDGGYGDGSVDFNTGNHVTLGFSQAITTCDGSSADFVIFTNSDGGGSGEVLFKYNGTPVQAIVTPIPSGASQSGLGGLTLDLEDGVIFNQVEITCVSGSIEVDAIAARILPSSSTTDVCFTADTSGVYTVTVTAVDQCGNVGVGTAYVAVQLNTPPVANAGSDFTRSLCDLTQICFSVNFSDPDGNFDYGELVSGPGTLNAAQVCFTPTYEGAYTFVIRAVDECGADDYDTVVVTVETNSPPVASAFVTLDKFICAPEQVCYTFSATDPDGGPLTWSHLSGVGSISPSGQLCFFASVSGTYSAAVAVSDSCGASDTTSLTYHVTVNTHPVATDPSTPIQLFQCAPQQICYQFTATDPYGGPLMWTLLAGDGAVSSSGQWCFTPVGSGTYSAVVVVADSCGAADTTSLTYNVSVNESPTIAMGNDTTLQLCDPQEICLSYTVSDPQGTTKLTEYMSAGFGAIDTAANQICFTPTTAGCYEFIVIVTDSCGASDEDTLEVCVTFGAFAQIDCPEDIINVFLCDPDEICQMIGVTPSGASVSASYGTYSGGQLCFTADTSGMYSITLIAQTACGADTCEAVFDVEIGEAAQIACPSPKVKFLCEPDQVCIPIGINGSNLTVEVTPIGTYQSGSICFPADSSGHYELTVIASTDCGADTCLVIADITINSAPVASDPASPVDTFLCAGGQVCYQFSASDPDGGTLTWAKISGNGSVSAAGLWCFNAAGSGVYSVTARVTDSCGAADTTMLTYNVTLNQPPQFAFGNDTTVLQCTPQWICIPYSATDPNGGPLTVEILSGGGAVDTLSSSICFLPSDEDTYEFIVQVTDSCDAWDKDTVLVTVEFNEAPVVNAGPDQNIFQCTPTEICWSAGATDPDNNLVSVEMITGPGTFDGNQICFTPAQSWCYEFILKATDQCGLESYDTVAVCVEINSPPVVNAGADQALFQCTPTQICRPVSCTDPDNNLTGCQLVQGPGVYDGSQICFTPSTSGAYTFVLQASDACGAAHSDTVVINVTLNSTPVCSIPNDTVITQCGAEQVCLPVGATDSDDNLDFCQIVSGPGTLGGGMWCYTPTASQVVTVTVRCQDECGAYCEQQFTVEFKVNRDPSIAFETPQPLFLCDPYEVCIGYTVSDPDDPQPQTVTLISGDGQVDEANSEVCFTPTTGGTYTFIIRVEDECGASAQDTVSIPVTLNTPPVVNLGDDQDIAQCDVEQICIPASCTDPDNNLINVVFDGPGTYGGGQICFTPTVSGTYQFSLVGTDACDAVTGDTLTVNVTLNSAPTIVFDAVNDTLMCTPSQLCLPYIASDPDGAAGLIERMVEGFGTIDTLNNQVCFTPSTDGTYQFIIEIEDSCGVVARDTTEITVTFGQQASITCPSQPVNVSLCDPGQVCYMLTIEPAGATVTTSLGAYSNGELCFDADTSGLYDITVIASDLCGADTCVITFNVDIGSAAELTCPGDQELFICDPDDVCLPVTAMGQGVVVTVTPIGYYSAGNVCFPADTSGHYLLTVIATTDCGADTCDIVADITINTPPIAQDPATPVDTFLCDPATICHQFTANDAESQDLAWMKLSGAGSVSGSGEWCFDANTAGTYAVTVKVTDECGAADTTSLTYLITTNSAPVVNLGSDVTSALCSATQLCFPYTVTDAQNNVVVEQLTGGMGILDTTANQLCFTPDTAGLYRFIVSVTDACNDIDIDTLQVTVTLNSPPVANAGTDQSLFLCESSPVCWNVSCTDPDGNLEDCYLLGDVGTYGGGQICFTPDTAGTYAFVLVAEDDCGATDQDTVNVMVTMNSGPVCNLPGDTAVFQCIPAQITLPVGAVDPDDNFDHCELLGGPGSLVNGNWVFTPSSDQTVKVKIMCVDECGATCVDSFTVAIDINNAPVADAGEDFVEFLCEPSSICWPVTASDVNGNLASVELVSSVGYYDEANSRICFTPTARGDEYLFVLRALDSCGAEDYDSVTVTVEYNSPPEIDIPANLVAFLDEPGDFCFTVGVSDPDDNLYNVSVNGTGTYSPSTDKVCFEADTTGMYCMTIIATDDCGEQVYKQVCIDIQIDECIHVQIEKTHNSFQGQVETVDIYLNGAGKELGGYDLLIAYDASALNPNGVVPGDLILSCGWEYFTYRYGANGNCSGGCPSGLLRIVAIAETNNGANHPDCYLNGQFGSLASINYLVSNNLTFNCQYLPVKFFWLDCGDNSFSSRTGDTLWISRDIYEFEGLEISDYSHGFPGYFGASDACLVGEPGKPTALRCVDFTNGGVDLICADSIDAAGDINLNNIPFEIADAVLFSNYFVYGLSVFTINVQGQIAATDINLDGLTLSVADLVYLIRIITGEAQGVPKLNPNVSYAAEFNVSNRLLSISQIGTKIGALSVVLEGEAHPELHSDASHMDMKYNFDGTNTKVLVYNLDGESYLESGRVLIINGDNKVKEIEAGSYDGFVMTTKLSSLPDHFELNQNYPNPFNPVTTIEFALPVTTKWELVIYNVLGQVVESFSERSEAGYIKVEWDASNFASGVYFYRLRAGSFSDTRKMVLLK